MTTDKAIRLPDVIDITGKSKPAIYADIKRGAFPAPFKIGLRAVAWLESDIQRWVSERVATRGAA